MAKDTKAAQSLEFFKYNPATDGDQTFNIDKALNENWDKVKSKFDDQDAILVPVTTSNNGLMLKEDKTKLNGIESGANKYTHPSTHAASMITGLSTVATSGSYNDLTNKPSTFPPTSHTHDDRYYTETEINSKLASKSDTTHNHDDRYYTESEMDSKLSGKSNTGHTHDYLPLSGGTLTGKVIVNVNDSQPIVAKRGEHEAIMGCSSIAGEYVFGGKQSSSDVITDYVRIGTDKLVYRTGGNSGKDYKIYHEGNKPTPAAIGAAASSHTHTKSQITDFPTSLPANGGNADTVDGLHATDFTRAKGYVTFGGDNALITTDEFIELLKSLGAFDQFHWVGRGIFAYASNRTISDTGIGNIPLAGSVVEKFGTSPTSCTIRVITPTTSSGTVSGKTHTEFIYVNNGSSYKPGWRKIWNDKNDGDGSGLDADMLDGKHASDFSLSGHTHDYLPLSGGTVTGNVGFEGELYTKVNGSPVHVQTVLSDVLGGRISATEAAIARTVQVRPENYDTQPLEIGRYIDFHGGGSSRDYDGRLSYEDGALVFRSVENPEYNINIPWEINQLKLKVKSAGDISGKAITWGYVSLSSSTPTWTYSNGNGGFMKVTFSPVSTTVPVTITVDGVAIVTSQAVYKVGSQTYDTVYSIDIPFSNSVSITTTSTLPFRVHIYTNK